jgi:hypothetical protein
VDPVSECSGFRDWICRGASGDRQAARRLCCRSCYILQAMRFATIHPERVGERASNDSCGFTASSVISRLVLGDVGASFSVGKVDIVASRAALAVATDLGRLLMQ